MLIVVEMAFTVLTALSLTSTIPRNAGMNGYVYSHAHMRIYVYIDLSEPKNIKPSAKTYAIFGKLFVLVAQFLCSDFLALMFRA